MHASWLCVRPSLPGLLLKATIPACLAGPGLHACLLACTRTHANVHSRLVSDAQRWRPRLAPAHAADKTCSVIVDVDVPSSSFKWYSALFPQVRRLQKAPAAAGASGGPTCSPAAAACLIRVSCCHLPPNPLTNNQPFLTGPDSPNGLPTPGACAVLCCAVLHCMYCTVMCLPHATARCAVGTGLTLNTASSANTTHPTTLHLLHLLCTRLQSPRFRAGWTRASPGAPRLWSSPPRPPGSSTIRRSSQTAVSAQQSVLSPRCLLPFAARCHAISQRGVRVHVQSANAPALAHRRCRPRCAGCLAR